MALEENIHSFFKSNSAYLFEGFFENNDTNGYGRSISSYGTISIGKFKNETEPWQSPWLY